MSFIVEDGTGKPNSTVYCTEAYADAYFTDRGNAAWLAQTDLQKQTNLIIGCDYLTRTYRPQWRGGRAVQFQALDWPRMNVQMHDYIWTFDGQTYSVLPYNIIPDDIAKANCEAAEMARNNTILPVTTTGQVVNSVKVGPIQIDYDNDAGARRPSRFVVLSALLYPYTRMAGGVSTGLVRA